MEKNEIQRKHLRNTLLKRVIIRADFTAMMNFEQFVAALCLQPWFSEKFDSSDIFVASGASNSTDRTSAVNNTYGHEIRRFYDCKIEPSQYAILDISEDFLCLDIKCDHNYEKIDPYLDLVISILSYLEEKDGFVKLKRLAIRKINGTICESAEAADNIFEYFDQDIMLGSEVINQRSYSDTFISNPGDVYVKYTRQLNIQQRPEGNFVFTIDIDTYLDKNKLGANLRPNNDQLKQMFYDRLNATLFDVFKRGVKVEYLNNDLREV